jgi:hypothetical protein
LIAFGERRGGGVPLEAAGMLVLGAVAVAGALAVA